MASDLYSRLRTYCCKAWGTPPPTFEKMVEGEELMLSDVLELVTSEALNPVSGAAVVQFLWPQAQVQAEKRTRQQKWVTQMHWLTKLARPKTPEEAAYLDKLNETLKNGK